MNNNVIISIKYMNSFTVQYLNNNIQDCIEAAEENILQIAPDD